MAALRPGAVLLEPEDVSLLTEELKVERDEDTGAAKPEGMMKVISWLRKKDKDTVEITNRVALHDIVNQERFTAGLTITGSEGIDAWARVGEDKVVLFQSKGQQGGSAVGQPGNNAVLTPKNLHDYIASLMLSAYASADNLVERKISDFCKAKRKDKRAKLQKELVRISVCVCLYACLHACASALLLLLHLIPQKVTLAFHHRRFCSHPCFRVSRAPPGWEHQDVAQVEQDQSHGRAAAGAPHQLQNQEEPAAKVQGQNHHGFQRRAAQSKSGAAG